MVRHSPINWSISNVLARFDVDYDSFIDDLQQNLRDHMEQTLPGTNTIKEKFEFIRAVFSKNFNKHDKYIIQIEDLLRDYYRPIYHQNMVMLSLVQTSYILGPITYEGLTYPVLVDVIRKFIKNFASQKPEENAQQKQEKQEVQVNGKMVAPKSSVLMEGAVNPLKFLKTKFTSSPDHSTSSEHLLARLR